MKPVPKYADWLEPLIAEAGRVRAGLPAPYADDAGRFAAGDLREIVHELRRLYRPGLAFLEWGSGVGAVTIAAERLGYAAAGIEIDAALVTASRGLAETVGSAARFVVETAFPPRRALLRSSSADDPLSLALDGPDGYAALDRGLDRFDLVFVFPFPAQAEFCRQVFARWGRDGARLLVYSQTSGVLESIRTASGATPLRVC